MNINIQTIHTLIEKRCGSMECTSEYGEPGYENPKAGVLLANWNKVRDRTQRWLERHGYALEWEDEWVIDYDGQRAYRTQPDSHDWEPSFILADDGRIIGKPDIMKGDCIDDYIEYLVDSSQRKDRLGVDWTKHGFVKIGSYERGTVPERVVMLAALAMYASCEFILASEKDRGFSIWRREVEA